MAWQTVVMESCIVYVMDL